ncbi:MAG: uridylate kinase [Methanohalophilus sp.]|nr:MAG: uridylate kinase [Methanohalophilus sp.]
MVMSTEMKAGSKSPVDPLAAKIIERCNIETIVMDGSSEGDIYKVVMQEKIKSEPVEGERVGTRIKS